LSDLAGTLPRKNVIPKGLRPNSSKQRGYRWFSPFKTKRAPV
jgi:hypothetical protein